MKHAPPSPNAPSLLGYLALSSAGLATAACAGDAPAAQPPAPRAVATIRLEPQTRYEVRRRFTGVVRSRRASELGFERGGLVTEVHVDEGDVVEPGQTIAALDTEQLAMRRRELVAQLREVEARVELSRITSKRIGELAKAEYTSRQARDEAAFGLQSKEAAADRLRAAVAAVDVALRKSRLKAPFGGTIARRLVDEGEVVAAGRPILRYLETDAPEAAIGVPVGLAGALASGSKHALRIDDRAFEAVLTAITDDVDPATRTRTVIFELPGGARVTDGQVAELELVRVIAADGFWLPLDAITEGLRGMWTAYSIDAEGRAHREAVEVLHTEGDRVFVRGTLDPGERVVASGLHAVVPGQTVAVADAEVEP
jgi:RND family efflux transporter MFP subunit